MVQDNKRGKPAELAATGIFRGCLQVGLVLMLLAPASWAQTSTFYVEHAANKTMTDFTTEGRSLVAHYAATAGGRCTKHPAVVMVPGLGLSASMYTGTPDGRDGWASIWAGKGYDVYVIDAPFTEPSGIDASRMTGLSRWSLSRVYSKWGFGAVNGEPYPNSQYPTDYMAELEASFPLYFSPPAAGQYASVALANNLQTLLADIGPATLMVHSAAGAAGFELLARAGAVEQLKALVLLEPVGCPSEEILTIPKITQLPVVALYGDFIAERGQTSRYNACKSSVNTLLANNGIAAFIDLPAMGIEGNSHLYVQAYNNGDIASLLLGALQGLQ